MAPWSHGTVAIAAGDAVAFERAYDEHARGVFGVACRVLGDSHKAQDVVQDVFLALWRDPSRFDAGRGPIGHYLRMVARSRAVDLWREAQVASRAGDRMRAIAEAQEGPLDERPVAAAEHQIGQVVLRRALMRLPDVQREAIVLAYWGGLTADEIAESSGTPVGTVKSRIRLGLLKLRERCAPDLDEQPLAA
jgi:RNA polymerase sigma-70 factor (ECF subfamily)